MDATLYVYVQRASLQTAASRTLAQRSTINKVTMIPGVNDNAGQSITATLSFPLAACLQSGELGFRCRTQVYQIINYLHVDEHLVTCKSMRHTAWQDIARACLNSKF